MGLACENGEKVSRDYVMAVIVPLTSLFLSVLAAYLYKKHQLIRLYADPRNKIVTFWNPEDFSKQETSSRRKRSGQVHRDILAEAKRIEEGKISEDSMPSRRNSIVETGTNSIIYSKNTDPSNPANKIYYEWEIDFKEIKLIEKVGVGQYGQIYRGEWLNTEVSASKEGAKRAARGLLAFLLFLFFPVVLGKKNTVQAVAVKCIARFPSNLCLRCAPLLLPRLRAKYLRTILPART